VKAFLDLQQKAAEVMAAVTIWETELNDIEMGFKKVNEKEKLFVKKKNTGPLYK
ncbi:ring finger protein nhl-1, partial [Lasius niger]